MTKCVRCGRQGEFDVCPHCLKEMKSEEVRMEIYDLRYSKYFTDHGGMSTEILNGFITDGAKVLEIGCGAGHLSNYLFENGMDVTPIDFSKYMVEATKKNYPHLNPVVMTAEELKFNDNTFDMVISFELIEHLYDIKTHLSEVKRILRREGAYFIKTPNKRIERIYSKLNRSNNSYQQAFHPSLQSHASLRRSLNEAGFSVRFLSIRELSDTQQKKIRSKLLRKFASKLIKYLPARYLPSITCVAIAR